MPNALNGFVTAIIGVLNGTILYYFLKGFVDAGILGGQWLILYDVLNLLTIFAFVHATRYWGTFYLFGWWFGFDIMWYSGLVDGLEFAIDSAVLTLVLLTRFL